MLFFLVPVTSFFLQLNIPHHVQNRQQQNEWIVSYNETKLDQPGAMDKKKYWEGVLLLNFSYIFP